jgi:hypothetical protein
MDEYILFNFILLGFGLSSVLFFIILLFITAGYGQHFHKKWGPAINNKLGWVIMELPTVIIYPIYYLSGNRKVDLVPLVFMFIWMLHYFQRTFIFPFLIRLPFSLFLPVGPTTSVVHRQY